MESNHLLSETDRQLGEQRAQADALATRSGLMIAATALLTGLLADSSGTGAPDMAGPIIWIVGSASAVGVLVFWMSRLVLGPSPSQLSRWGAGVSIEDLLSAKLVALEANSRALLRTELVFAAQALATVTGIVLLILKIQGGTP